MRTPVSAFVTFENEEGYNRALAIKDKGLNVKVLGEKVKLIGATEPTNIIWEHRSLTFLQKFLRVVLVIFVILLLLTISFSIIFTLKKKAKANNVKYQQANCKEMFDNYGDEFMNEYAVQEWFNYYQPKDGVHRSKVSPIVDCFCKAQFKKNGFSLANTIFTDEEK